MKFKNKEEYEKFLLEKKGGRITCIGDFSSMSKGIKHKCMDSICGRIWKPSPKQMLNDDYYCPSCMLHHRNNVDRFEIDRLKWTKDIPNTFYLYEIYDGENKLIKFGRTQHKDSIKRYPSKEIKEYKMKLIKEWRGKLIDTTTAENWWKTKSEKNKYFVRFSNDDFHGCTECINISDEKLKSMIEKTDEIINNI